MAAEARTEWTWQERYEQQSKRVAMLWKALLDAEARVEELEARLAPEARPGPAAAHATPAAPLARQTGPAARNPARVAAAQETGTPLVIDATPGHREPVRIPVERLSPAERKAPIEAVEGIGEVFGAQLRSAGIATVEEFFLAEPDAVADRARIAPGMVRKWHEQVRMQAIDGVGPQFAELLVRAGVRDLRDLAEAKPAALARQLQEYEDNLGVRVQGRTVTAELVADWVRQARAIAAGQAPLRAAEAPATPPKHERSEQPGGPGPGAKPGRA